MEHAYSDKDLFQLLDLVKDELDENKNFRATNENGEPVKQNCEWNKANEEDKKIYFVV